MAPVFRAAALLCSLAATTRALKLAPRAPIKAAGLAAIASPAHPVNAASVTMDFGYRLERTLDPDKRGPAEDEPESGMDALMNMCEPPRPELSDAEADAVLKAGETALAATAASKPATAATAAAAAAAAAATPDPASSAEPVYFFASEAFYDGAIACATFDCVPHTAWLTLAAAALTRMLLSGDVNPERR